MPTASIVAGLIIICLIALTMLACAYYLGRLHGTQDALDQLHEYRAMVDKFTLNSLYGKSWSELYRSKPSGPSKYWVYDIDIKSAYPPIPGELENTWVRDFTVAAKQYGYSSETCQCGHPFIDHTIKSLTRDECHQCDCSLYRSPEMSSDPVASGTHAGCGGTVTNGSCDGCGADNIGSGQTKEVTP